MFFFSQRVASRWLKLWKILLIGSYCFCLAAQECQLWLAPSYTSTSKHNIKYGIFAGRSYRANESLPLAEIAIPLIDMIEPYNRKTTQKDRTISFLESNIWTAQYAGTQWEGKYSAPVIIPGIGVLPQYHSGYSNVDFFQEGILRREPLEAFQAGRPHPARGAITPYYNVTLEATKDIPAGMELFANFGDVWDGKNSYPDDDEYQDTIYRNDYVLADKIIHQLISLYRDFPNLNLELQEDIMDLLLGTVLGTTAGKHAKTIRSLIPENPRRLEKVIEAGGTFMYRYSDMIHSQEWLSKNGYCLDSLRMGPSNIPDAGRGAFASRRFSQSEIIALSPMIHIADRSVLDIFEVKSFTDTDTGQMFHDFDHGGAKVGEQLLLNYCFGHPESSLLMFPLASHVGLINHNASPNAFVTWSRIKDNGLSNQHSFQDITVEALVDVDKIVMVMKVVALREIEEGEEVTIDYGRDWAMAWEKYKQEWITTTSQQSHPLQAEDLDQMYKTKALETTSSTNVYPGNAVTACFISTRDRPDGFEKEDENGIKISEFDMPSKGYLYDANRLFVADILERQETNDSFLFNYTALVWLPSGRQHKVLNVPHSACTFVNKPLTSDIHSTRAFRQAIGFPDRDFPQAWRDLR